jgi:glycosyltransferase involved in cell wall biosynthesis
MRLAIITTHPIQYYAPVFKLLYQRQNIDIKVFYTWGEDSQTTHDPGFNKSISWDISLLDGYPYEWVKNTSKKPGSYGYKGIVNPELIDQIKNYNPDALLVYGWSYSGHLKAIRYFKNKIPIFFRGDSTLLNERKGIKSVIKSIFLNWIYKHVDHAFYVGTNNKAYFKRYGLKEDQLTFAPHAIDNARFEIDRSAEAKQLRSSLNIGNNDILILYAGKFEPVKNVKTLVAAFANLTKTNAHLLLVGNGIDEEELRSFSATQNLKNVHFLNFVNQSYIPVVYQAADIFCLPSLSETWGLAVNEAMACGKAILLSNKVGCAVDLVSIDKNGYIFEAGNITDLTKKLTMLISNSKNELSQMGKYSNEIIRNWDFETQVKAIEAAINE